jgi:Tfp pilus assembly protein PilF
MSLITDLLSKIKQNESKRDVPPILRDAVVQSNSDRRTRKKLTIALVIVLIVVAAGFGAIYLLDYLKEPPSVARIPTGTAPVDQPAPQISAPSQKPQPEIRTSEVPSGYQKTTETTVTHGLKKDSLNRSRGKKISTTKYDQGFKQEASGTVREMKKREAASGMNSQEQGEGVEIISRQDKDSYLYEARTYEMQGKYRQALSCYKKVLTVEPNNYVVMNNISSMLIYLRSYEEAIQYAQKALTIRKDYASPLINSGIGYGYLGKVSESETYFRRALMIEPLNHNALLNLGLLYEKQSVFEKANEAFRKLSDTGNAHGYLGLARIAEKQKRITDAIHYYRTVVSTDTGDSHISNTAQERLLQLTK